jgi:hypothetical protein
MTVRRLPYLPALILAVAIPAGAVSLAPPQRPANTDWEAGIAEIDEKLAQHNWKAARRLAGRLAGTLVEEAWHQPGLRRTLARIARRQAIAEINLDRDPRAVWYWHLAWNLLPPTATEKATLADLGRASVLLEFPLRPLGKLPEGYTELTALESVEVERPKVTVDGGPRLDNTSGLEGGVIPDLHVEVLIDRQGRLSYPVVNDTGVHPIIVYVAIDWLLDHSSARPAQRNGQPVDHLQDFIITFHHKRGL